MEWRNQCNGIEAKVFAGLRTLWQNFNITSLQTRLSLVKSLMVPHFNYCDGIFDKT